VFDDPVCLDDLIQGVITQLDAMRNTLSRRQQLLYNYLTQVL
jgi:hypothetical protein